MQISLIGRARGLALIFILAFLLLGHPLTGQSTYGRYQLGTYFQTGNSLAILPQNSTLNNQTDDQRRGFVGFGIYYFIQLRSDSVYNTSGFFRFMRVDLGISNRAGLFEIAPNNYALVNSAGFDITPLFPLSFKAANEIDAYVAFGPTISYRYSYSITPSQALPAFDSFKSGAALEFGFRLKSGSVIGYKTMLDFGNYGYRVGTLFLGFSPQNAARKKRKTNP